MAAKVRTYTEADLMRDDASPKKKLAAYTEGRRFRIPRWVGDHTALERDIQKVCIAYLKQHFPTLRVEAAGITEHMGDGHAKLRPSRMKGWPDVIVCLPPTGRMLGMEFKRPGGTIDGQQIHVIRAINRAGGRAGVITSFEGMMQFLNRLGAKTEVEGVGIW